MICIVEFCIFHDGTFVGFPCDFCMLIRVLPHLFHVFFVRFIFRIEVTQFRLRCLVISNVCASVRGFWTVTYRCSFYECSALLAGHGFIHLLCVLILETHSYYFISACLVCLFLLQVYCDYARRACRPLCAFMANRYADYLLLLC